MTAEEKEPAGEALAVELHDRVDGGAGIEPLPGAAAPDDEIFSCFRRAGSLRSKWHFDHCLPGIQLALMRRCDDEQIAVR